MSKSAILAGCRVRSVMGNPSTTRDYLLGGKMSSKVFRKRQMGGPRSHPSLFVHVRPGERGKGAPLHLTFLTAVRLGYKVRESRVRLLMLLGYIYFDSLSDKIRF